MSTIEIIIISSIVLSAIVSLIQVFVASVGRKSVKESLDLFMCSFLGGLLGAFLGSLLGFAIIYVIALIIDYDGLSIFSDFGDIYKTIAVLTAFLTCWFLGTAIGRIKTIRPLLKLFGE